MSATIFYVLAFAAVSSTFMSVTRTQMIHAIIYLILSFFSLALIFFMMGAPLIAALEVLIYAGAIMVLFLFIVMMLDMGKPRAKKQPFLKVWGPAVVLAALILFSAALLFVAEPGTGMMAGAVFISPRTFGEALFARQVLGVEIVSLLLLFALVGSLYLGRRD